MVSPLLFNSLLSITAQKRFSKYSELGLSIFGFSNFGDEFIGLILKPFGRAVFGDVFFGDWYLLSGIYQLRNSKKGRHSCRINFYNYVITHEPEQQTRREKFEAAVAGWQGLTTEQKEVYNQKAKNKHYSGYNLYLREYLLS